MSTMQKRMNSIIYFRYRADFDFKSSLHVQKIKKSKRYMPQLDLLTFFTQFFWAILSFFIFYFFVTKLILPEFTRVLKYRSKVSALSSNSGDTNPSSITKGHGALYLSDRFGKSSLSTLSQYAVHNSARVLMQARQRKETFLSRVMQPSIVNSQSTLPSGKTMHTKEFAKSTAFEQESNQSIPFDSFSVRTGKETSEKGGEKDSSKSPWKQKNLQKVKTSKKDSSKSAYKQKNSQRLRDSESLKVASKKKS
ncbi:MAG: hypothetical protein EOP45_00105 [Sphingobacteriaceae bacterium]|nr:MAG: hypothetical protein EOP45_00105 [Sphingobacteriaceae bacterium]